MMCSLIDDRAAEKVARILGDTIAAGAQVHLGGQSEGRGVRPTVLSGVPDGCALDREEIFGPAVHVAPFTTLGGAIDRVNRSRFGLQAGIFTERLDVATRAFEGLEVGGVIVNGVPTFRVDHMPYGGVKDSGLGREGLREAYEAFTEPRLLVLPRGTEGP